MDHTHHFILWVDWFLLSEYETRRIISIGVAIGGSWTNQERHEYAYKLFPYIS